MAYKKDQGRFARMFAFWTIVGLLAYGFWGGFPVFLRGLFVSWSPALADPWVDSFPLFGKIDLAFVISMLLLAASAWFTLRVLNRPKIADTLIETETELRKVTWPTTQETWNGALAVVVTVLLLLVFLTLADIVLAQVLTRAMGGRI